MCENWCKDGPERKGAAGSEVWKHPPAQIEGHENALLYLVKTANKRKKALLTINEFL